MEEPTKYKYTLSCDYLYLIGDEFDEFIKDIQFGCRFSRKHSENAVNKYIICDRDVKFRYFIDIDSKKCNFIISNDDRRAIIRYLRKIDLIY